MRTWPGKNIAVTWEFEPFEGIEALWPQGSFERYLHDPKWSSQVRIKYENKWRTTMRHGPIRCNETIAAGLITADMFKCSENHVSASECNFECIPQTCVTQQMLERERTDFDLSTEGDS